MNDAVYPVRGGMEDWAYAASWDTKRVIQCEPDTYDSYPVSKTTYDSSTLRVFNMLVETSNDKTPNKSSLGTTLDLMSSSSNGNGHVARNIRLALLAAELVEPYVRWRTVNALRVSDDLVPMTSRSGSKVCQLTKAMAVPDSSETVRVEWTVGGALSISSTLVYFAKWDAGLEALLDCQQQPDTDMLLPMMKKAVSISETSGTTKFSHYGSSPSTFSAEIDISHFQTGDTIAVIALAQVDQNWGETLTENLAPELKPQSHMANVRTDPTWYHAKPDKSKIIQGRLNWVSVPLTLVLERFDAQSAVHAKELWHRYDESWVKKSSHSGTSGASEAVDWTLVIVGVAVVLAVSLLIGQIYLRYEMRQSRRERVREFIEDEGAVSPGLQQIATLEEKNGGSTIKNGYSDATMENNNNELELGTLS